VTGIIVSYFDLSICSQMIRDQAAAHTPFKIALPNAPGNKEYRCQATLQVCGTPKAIGAVDVRWRARDAVGNAATAQVTVPGAATHNT
jgi:hypothetical protein